MKKLFLLLIIMLVAASVFASGQVERSANGRLRDGSRQMTKECYVDGEFNIDLFLENSPIITQLDADGDGIVDGTETTIKDFMLARVDSFPILASNMGRGRKLPKSQGRR